MKRSSVTVILAVLGTLIAFLPLVFINQVYGTNPDHNLDFGLISAVIPLSILVNFVIGWVLFAIAYPYRQHFLARFLPTLIAIICMLGLISISNLLGVKIDEASLDTVIARFVMFYSSLTAVGYLVFVANNSHKS